MPDARRLERIAGQQDSYFLFCAVEETLCPNGVCLCCQVDDEFNRFAAAKHCFRNYPLQERAA